MIDNSLLQPAKLRGVDLNIMVVFDALMRERNVTRAGKSLGMTQSATSAALSRLRALFEDELFVRTSTGIEPTPFAQQAIVPVREGLGRLELALQKQEFDPAMARRTFRVSIADYASLVLLAPLIERLRSSAPGCSLDVARLQTHDPSEALQSGSELAIGHFKNSKPTLGCVTLLREGYSCSFAPDHPFSRSRLTVERFARVRHVLVSAKGTRRGAVDGALDRIGASRKIEMVVPEWTIAGRLVASSDWVLSGPTSVLSVIAASHGLMLKPLPKAINVTMHLQAVWPRRYDQDRSHAFLRKLLRSVAGRPSTVE